MGPGDAQWRSALNTFRLRRYIKPKIRIPVADPVGTWPLAENLAFAETGGGPWFQRRFLRHSSRRWLSVRRRLLRRAQHGHGGGDYRGRIVAELDVESGSFGRGDSKFGFDKAVGHSDKAGEVGIGADRIDQK
jgi:hypothetical protein